MPSLHEQFGEIDIYLFDQLLRWRLSPGMRVLDVGCGSGRNLVYLLQSGYEVFGIDVDPVSIQAVRQLASRLAPYLAPDNFRVEAVERMSPLRSGWSRRSSPSEGAGTDSRMAPSAIWSMRRCSPTSPGSWAGSYSTR